MKSAVGSESAFTEGFSKPSIPGRISKASSKEPLPVDVRWQWEHKSGFRDFDESSSRRIENAYKQGRRFVLVKSGKTGSQPRGVFFEDMSQHDPATGNSRSIRRTGPESCPRRVNRKVNYILKGFEKGQVKCNMFDKKNDEEADFFAPAVTYDDHAAYAKGTCASTLARSGVFTCMCASAVFLNSFWLGIDAEFNEKAMLYDADMLFIVVENVFTVYFTIELLIRFFAYKRKVSCLYDGWFVFDSILLVLMVGEVWLLPLYTSMSATSKSGRGGWSVLRAARMFKIVRLARLARLVQVLPDLYQTCKAIILAMRSTFFIMILLVILTYIFAILFVTQLRDMEDVTAQLPDLRSVHGTMWILTIEGVLLDGPKDTLNVLVEYSYMLTGAFILFIAISNFTLVNMLIGIICIEVDNVNRSSKEANDIEYLKNSLLEFLEVHDEDDDNHIKAEEFDLLMKNRVIHGILDVFGVDVNDLISLKDGIFESTPTSQVQNPEMPGEVGCECDKGKLLSFAQFLHTVLRLRGGNSARVRDVADLRDFVKERLDVQRDRMDSHLVSMEKGIHALAGGSSTLSSESKIPLLKTSQGAVCTPVLEPSKAEVSPLRQQAIGGVEELASRQMEYEKRQAALERELCLSRDKLGQQLGDVQKQLNHLCSLFGDGRISRIKLPHQVDADGTDDEDV